MTEAPTKHRPGRWATYDVMSLPWLPSTPGVYAFYFDDRLVYVGQSVNVANRIRSHKFRHGYARNIRTPWAMLPDDVKVTVKIKVTVRVGDWAMWEIRLIQRLNPIFNQQHRVRLVA